jgi:hypothetical protein
MSNRKVITSICIPAAVLLTGCDHHPADEGSRDARISTNKINATAANRTVAPRCRNGSRECDPWERKWTHANTPKAGDVVGHDGSVHTTAKTFISCRFPSGRIDYRFDPTTGKIEDVDMPTSVFETSRYDDARIFAIVNDPSYLRGRVQGLSSQATTMTISINRIDGQSELTASREPRGREASLCGLGDACKTSLIGLHSEEGVCKKAKAEIP